MPPADQEQQSDALDPSAEIKRLQALANSMQESDQDLKEKVETQITDLKKQIRDAKPLSQQISSLSAVIERKLGQINALRA